MEESVQETLNPGSSAEEAGLDPGPTPSENTNRLIALCLEAAAGRRDAQSLRQALTACRFELTGAKDAFYHQVKDEPGLLDTLPEAIEAVMDAFDAYGEALEGAHAWLTRQDPEVLQAAAGSLAEAYIALHQSLLGYEWAYLSHGDEPHPALNLMLKVQSALRQGLMDDERFDEILDRLWEHFTLGIETFEADSDPVRANRGAQASRQALAGIQDMDMYLEDHDLDVFEKGFVRFREGCLLLVEQIQDSIGEALIECPTPSPQVNWVIHAARAVVDGLDPNLLVRAQAWFEPQLAESYFRFEQCAEAALEGPIRMAEQVPVARDGFDRLNRSLPLLRLGIERRELLPRGIEKMETGANLLFEAWRILTEIEQGDSETPCPRCGVANLATDRVCAGCGAMLVRPVEPSPRTLAAEAEGPANLQRILSACQKAETGQIGADEFASVLAWAEQLLNTANLGLTRLSQDEEPTAEVRQAILDLRQGIAEFRQALDELQQFVLDGRPLHLSAGTRLLVAACDRLAEIRQRSDAT